ncbi:dTDP-4-dehydrorhamnose 3,5-epimerase family protein [Goodfellowiella coeruleoviolacea]|uniref:dTDP-4-dehydrorhamnose 3,5-epimerase n=1 Tax=Goodfellowiella coeruleoviolacea TaxID=334858 RepID=A0AAE3GLG7_9PSEU|nr:dTDP-4-dehydrorhamnose 3,5-epimerase family protein [Goodfellowiella coeruleoviolacea]MCP2170416.1 dTDP-4-dehydrorhamnose 3,5-epimerase [Goodfellowiella coeruleoviolacea]
MEVTQTVIPGAYRITSRKWVDNRGCFYEAFRTENLTERIGRPFRIAQANYSVSRRNVLRGIHGTTLPPGQEKLVTCVRGAVLDIVVDLRVGSPTFGCFDTTYQDANSGVAVYVADGIGHAFLALSDDVCMNYLCSQPYQPGTMIEIDALDPDLDLPWGLTEPPIMTDKDRRAPALAEAARAGLLPTYEECLRFYARSAVDA